MLRALLLRLADQEHIFLSVSIMLLLTVGPRESFGRNLALFISLSFPDSLLLPDSLFNMLILRDWQRECLEGEVLDRQLFYWSKDLDIFPYCNYR